MRENIAQIVEELNSNVFERDENAPHFTYVTDGDYDSEEWCVATPEGVFRNVAGTALEAWEIYCAEDYRKAHGIAAAAVAENGGEE